MLGDARDPCQTRHTMKTVLASIVALGFLSSAALACPHEDAQKQTEKKDTKDSTKQAQAPKAAPKAPTAPAAPATPAPKAPVKAPTEAPKT